MHHVDEALVLAVAHFQVGLDQALYDIGNVGARERRPDDLADPALLRATDGDLVPLLAVFIDTKNPDVADVMVAAGVHAAGNVEVTLAYVVLPQAIRLTVPPLTNRTIAITKNTALGTVIGVGEILNQATTAQSFSGNATPLMMGAIAYLILFIPVVVLGRFLETRFAWRRI